MVPLLTALLLAGPAQAEPTFPHAKVVGVRLLAGLQVPMLNPRTGTVTGGAGFVGADFAPLFWRPNGYFLRPTVGARLAQGPNFVGGLEFGSFYRPGRTVLLEPMANEWDPSVDVAVLTKEPDYVADAWKGTALGGRLAVGVRSGGGLTGAERLEYDAGFVIFSHTVGWMVFLRTGTVDTRLGISVTGQTWWERKNSG